MVKRLSVFLAVLLGFAVIACTADGKFSDKDRKLKDKCRRYLIDSAKFGLRPHLAALADIGGDDAIEVLKNKCFADDLDVRVIAATGLWKLGVEEGLKNLMGVMTSGGIENLAERSLAVAGIASGKRDVAVETLDKLIFREKDKQVKVVLIREYTRLAGPGETPKLIYLLGERFGRISAIEALERIDVPAEHLGRLKGASVKAPARVKYGLLGIAGRMGDVDSRLAIFKAIEEGDFETRQEALRAAGLLAGGPEALGDRVMDRVEPVVTEAMKLGGREGSSLVAAGCRAAALIGGERAEKLLVKVLNSAHDKYLLRDLMKTVESFNGGPGKGLKKMCYELIESGVNAVPAARAIGAGIEKKDISVLYAVATKGTEEALTVIDAFRRLEGVGTIWALRRLAKHEDKRVAARALDALGFSGAEEVYPELEAAVSSSDRDVKIAACVAICRLVK